MAVKPQLVYWDIRALAEPIRLFLRYLEVDFEDTRIPFNKDSVTTLMDPWFCQKYSHGLDFPNLPFYVDEDVKITQSIAILQHLGRKHNLAGDTLQEKATLDMIVQTVNDLRWAAWIIYNDSNFHEIKEDWKKTIPNPNRLGEMNQFLEGKEFVLASKISYADFMLYESVQWYREFAPEVFQEPELENLSNFQKRIEALPQIKKYLASENFKRYPIFLPVLNFGYIQDQDPEFKPMKFSFRNFFARYPVDQ